ncbi:MAG: hypothetical protein ABIT37_25445 [Luteolibacter sp.]
MKNHAFLVLSAAAGFCTVSCVETDPAGARQNVVVDREKEAATATLPRVITPGWHVQGDGKPYLDVTGYSRVGYVKDGSPKDVVEVFYHGQDNPRVQTEEQEFVTIMGRKLQTYSSGNEDPAFATQPVLLAAPNGKSAYYSFQFNNEHLYKTRQIPGFGW